MRKVYGRIVCVLLLGLGSAPVHCAQEGKDSKQICLHKCRDIVVKEYATLLQRAHPLDNAWLTDICTMYVDQLFAFLEE